MKFSMIVLIVLLALVAAFAVQNPGIITLRFMQFRGDTSLLVVIVAGFGAGVLGGWLAALPGSFRRRSEASAAAKRIRELEAEVGDLKNTVERLTPPPAGPAG
ncbi:MAG: LapA family protein [Deltaproteobacteria bacterium]|nr:LapA family protein [Deltaproteobacteria bacterium]